MASVAARPRPSDLAGIAIPPVSISATNTTTTTTTTTPPPTSPPWTAYSLSVNPFGDSNGRRDSFTTPYRRTSTSLSAAARPPLARSMTSASHLPRHAKLHKRSESASSHTTQGGPQVFTMPSPIQNEMTNGSHFAAAHARHSSANKIKPYFRKMSLRDDDLDQGRLDLSRPSAENESLAGLGIADTTHPYSRSVSDVSFVPATRRKASHSRATSGPASLSAAASGPLRPTQPFAPLREAPRSFTPPASVSHLDTSDDEADESVGVLTNDIRQPDYEPWKPRRSISISSGPAATPLSQTYTAGSLTKLTSASQSNLSLRSQPSYDQLKSGRSHRNTGRSSDYPTTPSARTSIDKAFSFITRNSAEPEDPASRAAAIRAARKAFEEKEAAKDRKYEKEEVKRRASVLKKEEKKEERKKRKSEIPRLSMTSNGSNDMVVDEEKAVGGTNYASQIPAHDLSLPIQGPHSGAPTMPVVPPSPSKTKQAKGGWNHFLAWTRTRLLNCGGKGSRR